MNERSEYTPKPLPIKLFDAHEIEQSLAQNNEVVLPKDTKVLLMLKFYNRQSEANDYLGLGPTKLKKTFRGKIDGTLDTPYEGMPENSKRIVLIPDSDKRRELSNSGKKTQLDALDADLAKEFLSDMQEDMELFNIDANDALQIRIHVAINRELKSYK